MRGCPNPGDIRSCGISLYVPRWHNIRTPVYEHNLSLRSARGGEPSIRVSRAAIPSLRALRIELRRARPVEPPETGRATRRLRVQCRVELDAGTAARKHLDGARDGVAAEEQVGDARKLNSLHARAVV